MFKMMFKTWKSFCGVLNDLSFLVLDLLLAGSFIGCKKLQLFVLKFVEENTVIFNSKILD